MHELQARKANDTRRANEGDCPGNGEGWGGGYDKGSGNETTMTRDNLGHTYVIILGTFFEGILAILILTPVQE